MASPQQHVSVPKDDFVARAELHDLKLRSLFGKALDLYRSWDYPVPVGILKEKSTELLSEVLQHPNLDEKVRADAKVVSTISDARICFYLSYALNRSIFGLTSGRILNSKHPFFPPKPLYYYRVSDWLARGSPGGQRPITPRLRAESSCEFFAELQNGGVYEKCSGRINEPIVGLPEPLPPASSARR